MPAMNITYVYGGKLYVNVTNRCTNKCKFCIRFTPSGVDQIDLWLEHEPSIDEILEALRKAEYQQYPEIIFCGYGEPFMRFDDIMQVCKKIKEENNIKVRVNTNGHANRIAGRDVTPEMKGLVDTLSISLNAKNAKEYNDICVCDYGEAGFDEMIQFAKKASKYVPNVVLSVVDILPKEDIEQCRKIAEDAGVTFRVRKYSE